MSRRLPPVRLLLATLADVQARLRSRRIHPNDFREWLIALRKDVRQAQRQGRASVHRQLVGPGDPPEGGTSTIATATWTATRGYHITIERRSP